MKRYKFPLLVIGILLIGAIPRAIELLSGNHLFLFDQGAYYQAVKDIVVNKHPTLIGMEVGGIGGFFQGPGFYYLLIIPFVLFGGNPNGGMVLMFIMGILTILLVPILFKNSLGERTSLLIALFIAASVGVVYQSRFIWPPFLIAPVAVLFLYFVFLAYRGKSVGLPLAAFTLGLMSHFEIATAVTFGASTFLTLLLVRPKGIFRLKTTLASVFLLIVTQLPLILFDLRHDFLNVRGIIRFATYSSGELQYSFANHLDVFKDALLSVSGELWIVGVLSLISAVGLIQLFKDKKTESELKKFVLFLVLNPLILFVLMLPLKSMLWAWWFLELPIIFCFIAGISFAYLSRQRKQRILVIVALLLFLTMFARQTLTWYRNDFNDYGGGAKIKGKIDAIDFVYKDANSRDFNLLVFTPPVYTYAYDYLLWWYGEREYGYIPGKEKKGSLYLIIEPDPEKPWSYEGWLETVIKTGEIEKTVTRPSGTIIQKRIAY